MKILVTGDQGYLGSGFIKQYGRDYDIVGYDAKNGDDLLNYENLNKKMRDCTQVVHLGAIPRPEVGRTFDDYFNNNVLVTWNVVKAAIANNLKRVIFSSSTTMYGIEKGIPFSRPITEDQRVVSQYIPADKLSCRDADMQYHCTKVISEQILAYYGLMKKIQVVSLRIGPIDKVFLGTSVSISNAAQSIKLALEHTGQLWFEPFSIVDEEASHIDISKAKRILGYRPEKPNYRKEQIDSTLEDAAPQ